MRARLPFVARWMGNSVFRDQYGWISGAKPSRVESCGSWRTGDERGAVWWVVYTKCHSRSICAVHKSLRLSVTPSNSFPGLILVPFPPYATMNDCSSREQASCLFHPAHMNGWVSIIPFHQVKSSQITQTPPSQLSSSVNFQILHHSIFISSPAIFPRPS